MSDNIFDHGCLVHLRVAQWGGRAKVPNQSLELAIDSDFIGVTKALVPPKALRAIGMVVSDARAFIYRKTLMSRTMPFPFATAAMVPTIDNKLTDLSAQFEARVREFLTDYPTYKEEAMAVLGDLYNEADYPLDVEKKFSFKWRFLSLTPAGPSVLNPELLHREQEKFLQSVEEFRNEAMEALRMKFAEMVDNIVKQLSMGRKSLREATIINIQEFMSDFSILNVAGDADLSALVAKARELLREASPERIKGSRTFREYVGEGMLSLQGELERMLVDVPIRRLSV